jgi:hypothetical protein
MKTQHGRGFYALGILAALTALAAVSCLGPTGIEVRGLTRVYIQQDGDIWKGEAASEALVKMVWGAPEEGWVYRNTANRSIYRYDGKAWVMIVDGSLKMETVTNIRVAGGFRPAPGMTRPVLVYFTDNTIDDDYIDGTTGIVVINHRREPGGPQKTFHTLRLLDAATADKKILLGRTFNSEMIDLNINAGGNIAFRAPVQNPNDQGVDYIPIGSMGEFVLINTDSTTRGGSYLQTGDLNMLGPQTGMDSELVHNWQPIGTNMIVLFSGTFDGAGKRVEQLYIDRAGVDNTGLFGAVGNGATLTNIIVSSGSVTGKEGVGGISGSVFNSQIANCSNAALVTGAMAAGGVAGHVFGSSVTACYNTGTIFATASSAGGVAGRLDITGEIIACYNTGTVVSAGGYAGGVTGWLKHYTGTIIACYNTGAVSAAANNYAGAVAGALDSSITSDPYAWPDPMNDPYIAACYWLNLSGDGSLNPSSAGVGIDDNTSSSFAGVTAFGQGGWPTAATDTTPSNLPGTYAGAWETGAGKYWKSLGNWNGGNYGRDSDFPRLWWE